MFVPVQISVGAGDQRHSGYGRVLDLTVRQLEAFDRAAGDMTEPLTTIGGQLRESVAAQFATEGAAGMTGRWQQLSPAYGEWKAKHGPGVPLLIGLRPAGSSGRGKGRKRGTTGQSYQASGRMKWSLLEPLATHVTARRLLYAPTSDYAGFHETGTNKMPARPPVDLTLGFLHSVDQTFAAWLAKLVREHQL